MISNDISSLFKLIAYRLNKTLADFINLVKLFDAKSLDAEELKKFDVILNATEMNLRFDKPTLKIQPSLSENDLHILRLLLNNLNEKFHLDKLIRPELYLEISASSRQEALMKQIEHIRKSLPLPANFYDSVYSPIIVFSSSAVIAVMMVLATLSGDWQSLFGMSVGSAVAVTAYVGKIFTPLENIGMEIENIQSAVAGIQRIETFFRQPQRKQPKTTLALSALPADEPALALNHVTFGYEKEEIVLSDCSFRVRQGETVTLAGRTGAGKSTIFKLILGLYSPQQGSVTIFGTPADQISDQQKRRLFGYVEQTLRPVSGTVSDQISLLTKRSPPIKLLRPCG